MGIGRDREARTERVEAVAPVKQALVTLKVSWDEETQDFPGHWDWEYLLGCDAEMVDIVAVEGRDTTAGP